MYQLNNFTNDSMFEYCQEKTITECKIVRRIEQIYNKYTQNYSTKYTQNKCSLLEILSVRAIKEITMTAF